ncbi:DUF2207 domain-containing protein [Nocardiopsis alba]|uniref:DUF2207 domain-containing protein n=1 Tax=Nocardiopsis alba TaxID=53437 RepID=A0ABV5DWP8_9ACTN
MLTALLFTVTSLASSAPASANSLMGDGITRYHTEAEIREDGTVEVTESITYDFGYRPSAGISRHIPVDLGSGPLRFRHVEVRDLEVRSPTGAETALDFEGVEGGEHLVLIGLEDSPETHVTKEQTYEISYTLVGAIVERRGHDEFHWNFVGTEWDVPKDDVSVEITAPEISDLSCHRKVEGEEEGDRSCHGFEHDGTTAVVSPSFLSEDEGMAVTVSLPSGALDTSAVLTELNDFWRPTLWSGSLALLMLVLAIACPMYRALGTARARRRMSDLPRDLHPLTVYSMLHDRVRASRVALILLALSEERGLVVSEPAPEAPGGRLFHLRNDERAPARAGAEHRLLLKVFEGGRTVDLDTLVSSIDRRLGGELRKAVFTERRGLVKIADPSRRSTFVIAVIVVSVVSVLLLFGEVAELLMFGEATAGLGPILLAAPAPVLVLTLGLRRGEVFSRFTPAGQRLRDLLDQARKDLLNGDPRAMDVAPSFELALGGVDTREVPRERRRTLVSPFHYRDPSSVAWWDARLLSSMGVEALYGPRRGRVFSSHSPSSFHFSGGPGGFTGGGGGGGGGGRR